MLEPHVRDCFISHASEDKEAIALPLAEALKEKGYQVWYDDFELEVGDSLREKIDAGLTGSRFGVVVLSERFFAKNWTKVELDALVARQTIGSQRIILPVWHEIDEEYLETVSPTLASIVGVPSSPLEVAVEKIARRIDRRKEAGSSGAALVAAQASKPAPTESAPEELIRKNRRVKLGYTEEERRLFRAEGGHTAGPGWLSIVVGPTELQEDLIDPTEIPMDHLREMTIDDQWYGSPLINRHGLKASLDGFDSRFPEDKDSPLGFWLKLWQDGLMEFGESLNTSDNGRMVLPYISIAEQIHDYTLLFARILNEVGYVGDMVAIAILTNMRGFNLQFPPGAYFQSRPIDVYLIQSRPLRTSVEEAPGEVNRWLKKTMDRFFLAAGIATGAFFLDEKGLV